MLVLCDCCEFVSTIYNRIRISIFNNDFTYRIDRKSLNLIEVDNNKKENSLAICNLVEGNIMKLLRETMNQQITKLKEGNKI